jgi:hypothetical protein
MVTILKRWSTKWEKIFVSYTYMYRQYEYKEFKKLNSPQISDPMKKWANNWTELFQRKKSKWTTTTKKNHTWRNAQYPWP